MGYTIKYYLHLEIKPENFKKAIDIFNHIHTDEMLLKYARGSGYKNKDNPVSTYRWYSWVSNPDKPYGTLKEAFTNWSIVEIDHRMYINDYTKNFVINGSYYNKWGQQDLLLEFLAPVLENACIDVIGEDNARYLWRIENNVFSSINYMDRSYDDVSISNDIMALSGL